LGGRGGLLIPPKKKVCPSEGRSLREEMSRKGNFLRYVCEKAAAVSCNGRNLRYKKGKKTIKGHKKEKERQRTRRTI